MFFEDHAFYIANRIVMIVKLSKISVQGSI